MMPESGKKEAERRNAVTKRKAYVANSYDIHYHSSPAVRKLVFRSKTNDSKIKDTMIEKKYM